MIWHCGQYDFDTNTPLIMGILDVTPIPSPTAGRTSIPKRAVEHGLDMVRAGAAIVDVGGERRPGATPVTPGEELDRIGDVVAASWRPASACRWTRHARWRRAACWRFHRQRRVGFRDPAMVDAVRRCEPGSWSCTCKGEPATMQDDPVYEDVVTEVRDYLRDGAAALEAAGIDRPHLRRSGPGFGKTPQANHRAHAQASTSSCTGLSGHGGGLAQALRGRGLPVEELHDRDLAPRPRRSGLRVGGERGAHPQRGDDGRRAEGLYGRRCSWAWVRTCRW